METREEFQRRLGEIVDGSWALAGLSAAVESGLVAALAKPDYADALATQAGIAPDLARRLIDVLVAIGVVQADDQARWAAVPAFQPYTSGAPLEALRAELRRHLAHQSRLVGDMKRGAQLFPWSYTDPEILRAHGVFSRATFGPIIEFLFPVMDRLTDRLGKPGAVALDVGTGVGGTAITLAQTFPQLKLVAIDPSEPALEEARVAIAAEKLADRIELRAGRIEDLADENAYDFVWLPQVFLGEGVIERAAAACLRALRPGGWLLSATISLAGDELRPAVARLRDTVLGGGARVPEELQKLFKAAGYNPVSRVPMPGEGTLRFTVAQRPEK